MLNLKAIIKPISYVALAILGVVGLALAAFFARFPVTVPPRTLDVAMTPALEARGAYLAEHVMVCVDCHSGRDPSRYSMPVRADARGMGGMDFGPELKLSGSLYAPNITPAALGNWTDAEILRAITDGVSKDGRALFPLMPYPVFATLCEDDAAALVRYVRNLEPIDNDVPKSSLGFPLNLLVRTMPAPAKLAKSCAEPASEVKRGERLVALASCNGCHSPSEMGKPIEGQLLSGGLPFHLPTGGLARSANLTPDPTTGLGGWTRQMFIDRFKLAGRPADARRVEAGSANTVMPWTQYSGMTEEDLGAIYSYLRSIPPVKRHVVRFEASSVNPLMAAGDSH